MALSVTYANFGGMLVSENRDDTERQYVRDPLGNLVAEIDTSEGETYKASYWPYGEVESQSGSRQSDWGFIGLGGGYLFDLATLLYVRARFYLPLKSRWLTVDPLWSSTSAYSYARLNPIALIDKLGLQPQMTISDCPPPVEAWLRKLCEQLNKIDAKRMARISGCIERNSHGGCKGLTSKQLECMKRYCKNGDVRCYPGRTPSGDAGTTTWTPIACFLLGMPPYIDIGNVQGSNRYDYLFDELPYEWRGTSGSLRDIGLIFFHELGHACGVDHRGRPGDWQCNDVFAWCIYASIW